jgi:hypothetical protein
VVAFGALVAGCILGGMIEVSLFVFTVTGLYALYRLILAERRWPAALRLGAGTVLGLLLAAPLLVLFVGYLPVSLNQHNAGAGLGHTRVATLLNWLVPFVNGYPAALRIPRFGPDRSWLGAAGAVLLVAAVASPAAMRRRAGWLFLAVGGVLLLKVHGFPGLAWMGHLPLFSQVNFVAWAPGVISFCFAVVVAIGVSALEQGSLVPRRLVVGVLALGAVTLVLLLANRPVFATPPHQSPWRQYLVYAVALAAAGGVLLACLVSAWVPRLLRLAAPVAAGVMALELLVLFAPGAYAPRTDPYRAPPWLGAVTTGLATAPHDTRVFGFDQKLYPDTAAAFGIQDARVVDGLDVKRYATFVNTFVTRFYDRLTGDTTNSSEIEGNVMFDLLGVRYVLTGNATPLSQASGQFTSVVQGDVSVYQNNHVLPRAFVASDVRAVGSTAAALSYLKGFGHQLPDGRTRLDRFDPTTQAVVESPDGSPATSSTGTAQARTATIVSYEPDRVVVDVAAGAPGLLVLTDTYAPGWQASEAPLKGPDKTVGGRPAQVLPTDVAFRGVPVGGAATRVVFRYRPPGATLMWLLPLAGLVGMVAWWLVRRPRTAA